MCSFVEKLPKATFFIFVTGSLAVSVTDMTAPVVGSSGGVYALVSAHLANVVMVSLWVCALCGWLSHHSVPVTTEHWHIIKAGCLRTQQGRLYLQMPCIPHVTVGLSFSQRSKSVCALLCDSVWWNPIVLHTDICSLPALLGLNTPTCVSSQTL